MNQVKSLELELKEARLKNEENEIGCQIISDLTEKGVILIDDDYNIQVVKSFRGTYQDLSN